MARDLTGMVFGRLHVVSRAEDHVSQSGYRTVMWNCKCTCGNDVVVRAKCLTSNATRSCGCFARENMSRLKKKHGEYGTRLYAIWNSMRQRCLNSKHRSYHNYGGRGITICAEWDDFDKFRDWAFKTGYDVNAKRGECTLDRIDVDKGYSPGNCRWATMKAQSSNKRETIYLENNGEVHSLIEWSELTGVKYQTMWKRYKNGKSTKEILSQ